MIEISWLEVSLSILGSSGVSGYLIFILQQKYKSRLDILLRKVDFLEKRSAKDFEHFFSSMIEIWSSLVDLEDYFRFELAKEIESGTVSFLNLRPFLTKINKAKALLPEQVYEDTNQYMDKIIFDYHHLITSIQLQLKENPNIKDPNLLSAINALKDKFDTNVTGYLSEIRLSYRSHLDEAIQNDKLIH